MKNKSIIVQFYIYTLALCITGCETFVETDLPSSQINTEDVFNDIGTVQAALTDIYAATRDRSVLAGDFYGMGCIMGIYTDDLDCFVQEGLSMRMLDVYRNNFSANNQTLLSFWKEGYTNLYAINLFIENLSASEAIEEQDKSIMLSEAVFLRALYYHYLAQLYGDLPYITGTDYRKNSRVKKMSYNEVLKQVEKDLLNIVESLPEGYRNDKKTYPNRATAELLLAKNYLLLKEFEKAEQYSHKVIDNPLYKMEENPDAVFKNTSRGTLWQFSNTDDNMGTKEANTYVSLTPVPNDYALTADLIASFDKEDLRFKYWVNKVEGEGENWYHAYKYKNRGNQNPDEYSIVYRIEEAYFTCAEALAYQGKIQEAVYYLNLIKHRAGIALLPKTISKEELISEMLEETRKEFFTEHGHRFLDLKRNNRLEILKNVKSNWQNKHQLLPYPESEILLNPNLLPQNVGY